MHKSGSPSPEFSPMPEGIIEETSSFDRPPFLPYKTFCSTPGAISFTTHTGLLGPICGRGGTPTP